MYIENWLLLLTFIKLNKHSAIYMEFLEITSYSRILFCLPYGDKFVMDLHSKLDILINLKKNTLHSVYEIFSVDFIEKAINEKKNLLLFGRQTRIICTCACARMCAQITRKGDALNKIEKQKKLSV